jgi:acyl-CoA thioesterase-2
VKQPPLDLADVFELEPHGPDTFIGESPAYAWGRVYGGLAIAQALWAATQTVRREHGVHSLHAYFILGGEISEPVRYEVDRVRNGRSFTTRRVIARQSAGAILTLACSFQVAESGPEAQSAVFPHGVPDPETLEAGWDAGAYRCDVAVPEAPPRSLVWARFPGPLDDDPRLHACALAYHAMWFHRPVRADDWVLFELTGHGIIGSRGLATGPVFHPDGTHVATIAQEGLLRDRRRHASAARS